MTAEERPPRYRACKVARAETVRSYPSTASNAALIEELRLAIADDNAAGAARVVRPLLPVNRLVTGIGLRTASNLVIIMRIYGTMHNYETEHKGT